ncbi:MG2 domain-containing protein [Hymenobacter tenuis]
MHYPRLLLAVLAAGLLVSFRLPLDEFARLVEQQLARFYQAAAPEKAYLHFDKDSYAAGETIWFKAYVVDAARHQPDSSRAVYVDLIGPDQQVLGHQVLALQNGGAPGDFVLPPELPQGGYTVRAYTSWMRNTPEFFFSRVLPVWSENTSPSRSENPAGKPDVQFFPEGGQLVNGVPSVVGFKATGPNGLGLAITGTVQDAQGNVVAELRSQHLGMGRFELVPAAGQRYTARIRPGNGPELTYALPAAQPSGLALRVQDLGDAYQLTVQRQAGATDAAAERITVMAHVRGRMVYLEQTELQGRAPFAPKILKSQFPAGIIHFTVFDSQRAARCERLAFADTDPGVRLTLQPDKAVYAPREKVTVKVAAQGAAGRPVAADFSLAVTEAALAAPTGYETDIRTHLLVTSDLRGHVEQPAFYFTSPTPATKQALDDLLLTQGWRRFAWQPLLAGQLGNFPHPLERTLSLRGRVVGSRQEPLPGVTVELTRSKSAAPQQTLTDAEGRFVFTGFSGLDTALVRLEAKPTRKVRQPQLLLDTDYPAVSEVAQALQLPMPPENRVALLASARSSATADPTPNGRSILLSNVTIKGSKAALKPDNRRIYGRADAVIQTKNIAGISTYRDVVQVLQGRVAGLSVVSNQNFVQITMRGVNSVQQSRLSPVGGGNSRTASSDAPSIKTAVPLFLLDGVPTDINMINSVPVTDFETIEVLKPSSAAIFGDRAGAGAIAFFTKYANPNYNPAADQQPTREPNMYMPPRFYQARKFYEPAYGTNPSAAAADKRGATIYWNPTVHTSAAGVVTISFYTSEKTGVFRLQAEGLSPAGSPGRGTAILTVEKTK